MLGFLLYWQKQVAGCALSLAQHAAVGAAFPTMAGAHGVSCVGAHVVAASAGASASRLATASAARNSATHALLAAMPPLGRFAVEGAAVVLVCGVYVVGCCGVAYGEWRAICVASIYRP